jgi:hypothetical protein
LSGCYLQGNLWLFGNPFPSKKCSSIKPVWNEIRFFGVLLIRMKNVTQKLKKGAYILEHLGRPPEVPRLLRPKAAIACGFL